MQNINDINQTDKISEYNSLEKSLYKLMGVYFIVNVIIDIPNVLLMLWRTGIFNIGMNNENIVWSIQLLIQFIIGIILIKKTDDLLKKLY